MDKAETVPSRETRNVRIVVENVITTFTLAIRWLFSGTRLQHLK